MIRQPETWGTILVRIEAMASLGRVHDSTKLEALQVGAERRAAAAVKRLEKR